ncbi:MAG: tRNA pseudouridine(38-40) synthase TruA [Verrucomicrobiota bacterium]
MATRSSEETRFSEPVRRFRMEVAYDGRGFEGWQSQPGGKTVQDLLLQCLRGICEEIATIQGSGRTDAGVSANGQVAHFDVPMNWKMRGGEWQRALNSSLPPTIRVLRCEEVASHFHARFSAVEKEYRYDIFVGEVLPPLLHGLAWHQRHLATVDEISKVLSVYEGSHDFRAFSANRHDGHDETRDTRRTLTVSEVELAAEDLLRLRFRGNGFLYKMVRFLVGTAAYQIREKISRKEVEHLLTGCDPVKKAPFCAPPDGLSLEGVFYPTVTLNLETSS